LVRRPVAIAVATVGNINFSICCRQSIYFQEIVIVTPFMLRNQASQWQKMVI